MLRLKVYNSKKKQGLNGPLRVTKNELVTDTKNFKIIKDQILGTYIMHFKNTLVIHLSEYMLYDFIYLYKHSTEYVFDIYETNYLTKDSPKTYHIFCISASFLKKTNFLNGNDCIDKWKILNDLYGPCLIINRYFLDDPKFTEFTYTCTIGKGVVNYDIKSNIKTLINVINNHYLKYLPIHYLNV